MIGILIALTLCLTGVRESPHDRLIAHMPACVNEDGPGVCKWDATVRGNHHGRSFWIDQSGNQHDL